MSIHKCIQEYIYCLCIRIHEYTQMRCTCRYDINSSNCPMDRYIVQHVSFYCMELHQELTYRIDIRQEGLATEGEIQGWAKREGEIVRERERDNKHTRCTPYYVRVIVMLISFNICYLHNFS